MKVQKKQNSFVLHQGDCLEVLRTIPHNTVDSIVTDPPYGLSFMGKKWDYDVPSVDVWAECLRVLKPGGHLLAFAGTRTQHRMAVRIEDAGFEIRDMIAWVYGSGFPKSLDVSKAIDKAAGAERTESFIRQDFASRSNKTEQRESQCISGEKGVYTLPATDLARQWSGWGTALKPAFEPITVARKPLVGTVAENVLAHGTGGLNINGCRVAAEAGGRPLREVAALRDDVQYSGNALAGRVDGSLASSKATGSTELGRWPANLIHDGSEEVLAVFPQTAPSPQGVVTQGGKAFGSGVDRGGKAFHGHGDTGSAARFFYCAKASKRDRGLGNNHPTVKPTELMRYLCRLVTPLGGTILDPFMGSGSTGKAAGLEGFSFVGIEKEQSYVEIAEKRIKPVYDLESGSESTEDDDVAD